MNKAGYSYRDCLVYSLCLFRKHYREGFSLDKQEELYRALIVFCRKPPAAFWACLQEQNLNYLEYKRVCRKIKSYLLGGEPVPYLSGECVFSGNLVRVRKGVFIPQPDTEVLVDVVLFLGAKICSPVERTKVLEVGCGSGNIAIALAMKKTSWDILATDINRKALSLAEENTSLLNIPNVQFLLSDKFSRVTGRFHIIVSNPPYIAPSNYKFLDRLTKKQPREALLSASDGYFFYESIIEGASSFLREKFLVAFEIGNGQGETVIKIILKYFPSAKIEIFKDFSKNARVIAFYQQ